MNKYDFICLMDDRTKKIVVVDAKTYEDAQNYLYEYNEGLVSAGLMYLFTLPDGRVIYDFSENPPESFDIIK